MPSDTRGSVSCPQASDGAFLEGLSLWSLNVQRIYIVLSGELAGCLLSLVCGKDICGSYLIWKPCPAEPFGSSFHVDGNIYLQGLQAILFAGFSLNIAHCWSDCYFVYISRLAKYRIFISSKFIYVKYKNFFRLHFIPSLTTIFYRAFRQLKVPHSIGLCYVQTKIQPKQDSRIAQLWSLLPGGRKPVTSIQAPDAMWAW